MQQNIIINFFIYSHNYPKAINLSKNIISIDIVKDINAQEGQWQVQVKQPPIDLLSIVRDDDWVKIDVISNNEGFSTFGLVNSVREHVSLSQSNSLIRVVTITGSDISKIFTRCNVLFNPVIPNIPGLFSTDLFKILENSGNWTPGETLGHVIGFLLNYADYGNNSNLLFWKLPDSMPKGEPIVPNANGRWETARDAINIGHYIDKENITGTMKNLFSLFTPPERTTIDGFIRPFTNSAWNDFFYDTRRWIGHEGGIGNDSHGLKAKFTPAVIFRPKPYLNKNVWQSLPLHEVKKNAVTSWNFGVSGSERLNYYMVTPYVPGGGGKAITSAFWAGETGDLPILEKESIEQHGLRMLDIETNYIDLDNKETSNIAYDLTKNLYLAYHRLADMLTGTIQIKHIDPTIQVGERLLFNDIEFYVEAYHLNARVNEFGITIGTQELQLTRGMNAKMREVEKPVRQTARERQETAIARDVNPVTTKDRFPNEEPENWVAQLRGATKPTKKKKYTLIPFNFHRLSQPWKECGGVYNEALPEDLYGNAKALARNIVVLQTVYASSIIVVSGYRSHDYNLCVGGVTGSQHTYGKACDFYIGGYNSDTGVDDLYQTIEKLIANGKMQQGGLGVYHKGTQSFIHYDNRGYKTRWTDGSGYDDANEIITDGTTPDGGNFIVDPKDAPSWQEIGDEYIT